MTQCFPRSTSERGNIFVMAFLAIILMALLTTALRGSDAGKQSISKETLSIRTAQLFQQASQFETGVKMVLDNGASETEIRFAHPDAAAQYGTIATTPKFQVFSQSGGHAAYMTMPTDVLVSGTGKWEFYGTTRVPDLGSQLADLVAVMPNVTEDFCTAIDTRLGMTTIPQDHVTGAAPDCIEGGSSYRFGPSAGFNATPNTMKDNTFDYTPATQACVRCGTNYHYYHVLLGR